MNRRDRRGRGAATAPRRAPPPGHERLWVAGLLALHAALAVWGAARNSVTFDENFHLPAGIAIVAYRDLGVSAVNPPLVKALCALPALAAGARVPTEREFAEGNQYTAGMAFMRRNADRYHRVYFAARLVTIALSLLLGLLVWRFARRLHGPRGALLALAFYALAPEALAHAGFVTMDVATALGLLATLYAWWAFMRGGRWWAWGASAAALGATALTRFTAWYALPMLLALLLVGLAAREVRRPRRAALGLALLPLTTLLALHLGYLGQASFRPLGEWTLHAPAFLALKSAAPWLRLPLPDDYLAGLDWQTFDAQPGRTPMYLLGRIRSDLAWAYFPLAMLFKWPLGFLGALAVGTAGAARRRARRWRPLRGSTVVLLPAGLFMLSAMFLVSIPAGIRYVLPLLPLLCIALGSLAASRGPRPNPAWRRAGFALALLQGLETATAAPDYLAFFNAPSGGKGGGLFLVNDSNVDWGQGLIALREEMRRRGIARVHLAYHGTADPAVYGIDYVPFTGGNPGPESDWIAISSYYFVGLRQRMMTPRGPTDPIGIDFRTLWTVPPVARPAGCMLLFPIVRASP